MSDVTTHFALSILDFDWIQIIWCKRNFSTTWMNRILPTNNLFVTSARVSVNITNCTTSAFLVTDNRFLMGYSVARHVRSFARTTHSANLLRNPLICYVRFARLFHSQARSLTWLAPSWNSWNLWVCVHTENALYGSDHVCSRQWKLETHPL